MGGWWRWALVSPDGVAPSQMVGVSASVNLPLHHKSRSSLLAPAHPGGPGKGTIKWLSWWWWCFDAVGWVAGRASGLKKLSGTGVVICLERRANDFIWSI